MLFADLPLYTATYKVYCSVDRPGSEVWMDQWERAYALVLEQLVKDRAWTDCGIPWNPEQVREAWRSLRKTANDKLKTTCEVAILRGPQCFYWNRGVGDCSEEVNLDRIRPASRGGQYLQENCVIACSYHNQSRGDLSIEEFLGRKN